MMDFLKRIKNGYYSSVNHFDKYFELWEGQARHLAEIYPSLMKLFTFSPLTN